MSTDRDVVVVEGLRTPFAKAGTALKDVHAVDLGRAAVKELIARSGLPERAVDEVILGNVGNPSDSANVARVVALRSGLPQHVPAYTVHRNCASSFQSVTSAFEKIRAGEGDVVIAGGTESMSQLPLLLSRPLAESLMQLIAARTWNKRLQALKGISLKELKPRMAIEEGLTDPVSGLNMGQTAEVLAKEFGISREEQDEYALRSHVRTVKAQKAGSFNEELIPVFTGRSIVDTDVGPREDQRIEQLQKLKPYFDKRYGSVTVGNACSITDGAGALMVMSRAKARELGYTPRFKIRHFAYVGLQPERMGLGPVKATARVLEATGLSLAQMGVVELNEAFAAQVLACQKAFASREFAKRELNRSEPVGELRDEVLNVNGGAIALGHPVGATGARLLVSLMKEMGRRSEQYGLATLCIGGGQGGAIILEQEDV